jgi:hypothetical protein
MFPRRGMRQNLIFFAFSNNYMETHLWSLLRLTAESDDALKELYRKVYLETYVRDAGGHELFIQDWMGNRVKFHAKTFDHAFSESSNYRFSYGVHDTPFSKRRARHMLWIKEVLSATKGTIERRHQTRMDNRNRPTKRRSLIVVEEKYVVVLTIPSPCIFWPNLNTHSDPI